MCKLDYDKMREPEFNGMAQSEINSVKDYYEIIPDLPTYYNDKYGAG